MNTNTSLLLAPSQLFTALAMSSSRSTRSSGDTTAPALSPTTTLVQLNRLPVATLLLYLNQYHLVQNGNKAAKAQRLYSHLQSLQDAHISSCSGSDRSSSDSDGEQSEDEGEAPPPSPTTMAHIGRMPAQAG